MVKLVSARECRSYGPRQSRRRAEYMNAGLYLFSALLLISGYAAQLSGQIKLGLIILLVSFSIIIAVNLHDLFAHLAGIDFRLGLMGFDRQLALVEFAVPVVQAAGTLLSFLGIIFLFIQEKRDSYFTSEKHAMGMLIAGPALWVLGSILNSCQIYERADGHVQLLQHSVQIPFLIGSCMFLVGAILNSRAYEIDRHGVHLLV
ncbi:uncharacterized protein LOC124943780 [Impatiens glandulifera]|uniref:uncharacterized protein LOC124943780 n=1 Tax=Impatiens glandulifera TaxID=253017 RepID=UPI001FB07042|nr:uncharacterized protein LOC124943780 [Impatiens glandulifera]